MRRFLLIGLGALAFLSTFSSEYRVSKNRAARFVYHNVVETATYSWPQSLISYTVHFENIEENCLVLRNTKSGNNVPFQLSNRKVINGQLQRAELSFMAELRQGEDYSYELFCAEKSDKQEPLSVKTTDTRGEWQGKRLSVRFPVSNATLSAYQAPAPVLALNESGAWIGNNLLVSPKRRIVGFSSQTTENGSLFTEQTLRYTFEGGGAYQVCLRMVNEYPFVIVKEEMENISLSDEIRLELSWEGFHPQKRFGVMWDRVPEGQKDLWTGIDQPIYASYSKEDPHWTGRGWVEDTSKEMIFKLYPFGGNSVREQTPVLSFWENQNKGRELGIFVFNAKAWNDKQYSIWQPTPDLSVKFRYTDQKLVFTYPLAEGTRSTALSLFKEQEGETQINLFKKDLQNIVDRWDASKDVIVPTQILMRYSQLLMMRYSVLSLDKVKEWILEYPKEAVRPSSPFGEENNSPKEMFVKLMATSPMVYYPVGLNFYPGVHSIAHRILYSKYIEGYLKNYASLDSKQRKSIEALLMLGAYVNMEEEMNASRRSLAGTPNMAADGWCVTPQIAFLFPQHPMASEWLDYFEKQLELNGLYYTRPTVSAYESKGGRWTESLGIYNWAYLRPTTHSNTAGILTDGKNRFANPYMEMRGTWMRDMMTAPIENKGRAFPPHGAHGGGYLVPRYDVLYQTAEWLKNYNPLLAEQLYYSGETSNGVEIKSGETDWHKPYKQLYPSGSTGTNPHLKSCKYTGHGIVLRAGVDTPEELSIHLNQVDKGPNYRWGNQGCGNTGGLYFYAQGKVLTAHENEMAGDHTANNLDGVTNFGVMKNGDYRTIGYNELKSPLFDFGGLQFAELLSDDGVDRYAWPEYLSRSVMLVGTDYFILFDETGTNWRAQNRFSWFNAKKEGFPLICFLSSPARKDGWMTAQTPNSRGFYRDAMGSVLTLVSAKKENVKINGGKTSNIPFLNDNNISEFRSDNRNKLPEGVFDIATESSKDLIFRRDKTIEFNSTESSFIGKAGAIRRHKDGRVEMAIFKGTSITANNTTLAMNGKTNVSRAACLTTFTDGRLMGCVQVYDSTQLRIGGIASDKKLYINGVLSAVQPQNKEVFITLVKGKYTLELTTSLPIPMESRIVRTAYNKGTVTLYLQKDSPCQTILIEASNDGGKSWKSLGSTRSETFVFRNTSDSKIHVCAVSMNGNIRSESAPEYPVYFSNKAPHYPEGLNLRLSTGKAEISWGEVLGVTQYRVYRRKAGDKHFAMIYQGLERHFTDHLQTLTQANALPGSLDILDDSANGVVYEYCVTATNGYGESLQSPIRNSHPASWLNWYPDTSLRFKRRSAFWMPPYVDAKEMPEPYYPE